MAKNDWYTFRRTEEGYEAFKYNQAGERLSTYTLNERGTACDCPAHVPFCRHKKMLVIFKDMKRVNTGWLYNIDLDKWIEPKKVESSMYDSLDKPQ